jgi:hypothetical protein
MTTFYRDREVYVGSRELLVDDLVYRLDDLQLVWHRRGPRGTRGLVLIASRLVLVLTVIAGIAGAGVALRGVDLGRYNDTMVLAGAVLAIVVLGTIGLFVVEGVITLIERSYEHGGVEHQIWARYGGRDVLLFATRDKSRFGQVYRALQRAIERSEP